MAKARVSVTVDRVLLRRCDRVARGASRSQVFKQALERWLRDLRQRSLEEEVERHYSSLSGVDAVLGLAGEEVVGHEVVRHVDPAADPAEGALRPAPKRRAESVEFSRARCRRRRRPRR